MHNPEAKHQSIKWMILVAVLIAGILAVHLFGLSYLFASVSHSTVFLIPIVVVAMGIVVVWHAGIIRWLTSFMTQAKRNYIESDVVSRNGLHWHPEISIFVKGVKQEIPHMGLSDMDMSAMHKMHSRMQKQHMHEGPNDQGIIHLKFQGLVLKSDIMLGEVFKKLGKNTRSYGTNLKMTVNGKENTEYENYVMQDKDKIELRYE